MEGDVDPLNVRRVVDHTTMLSNYQQSLDYLIDSLTQWLGVDA